MNYKLNSEKIREILSDKNSDISGIEKHLIQEGLKQITLGTGPIRAQIPGSGTINTITTSLELYLTDVGAISKVENKVNNSTSIRQQQVWDYKGMENNSSFFGTQKDWNHTLIAQINKICSTSIKRSGKRNNYIITSSDIGSILIDTHYFTPCNRSVACYDKKNKIERFGTLGYKYEIFLSYDLDNDIMIVGESENEITEDFSTWPKLDRDNINEWNSIIIENLN